MEQKSKKILFWTIFSIVVLAIVTAGIYILFIQEKKEQEPTSDGSTQQIQFQTTKESVARAIQFDVGQADCGLVQVSKDGSFETRKDNFNILIDAGTTSNKPSQTDKKNIEDKISNSFVTNIDLIVISHLHADHIGAMTHILNSSKFTFKNTTCLFNWAEARYFGNKLSSMAKTMFNDLKKKNITLTDSNYWANLDAPKNRLVDFGDNNYFSVLGGTNVKDDNENAWSVVNRMQWMRKSILYTGDLAGTLSSEGVAVDVPKKHYSELDCDILKAPHHGSVTENSNGIPFLNKVSPNEVWISAGVSDKYTLPDGEALENYSTVHVSDANIKGTEKFGNPKSLEQIKQDLIASKPGLSEADAQKQAQKIFNAWKKCNEWVKLHPTANNNNRGFGDINCNLNTIAFKRQSRYN